MSDMIQGFGAVVAEHVFRTRVEIMSLQIRKHIPRAAHF